MWIDREAQHRFSPFIFHHIFGEYIIAKRKESKTRKITIYRDDSTTQVIYENVKHVFWTANNTVLVIAQYNEAGKVEHRYIHWLRERFVWFKDEKA